MQFKENDKSVGLLNILSICVAICLAIACGVLIFLSQLKNVSINYEGKIIVSKTMATTVEDVLKEKKLAYNNKSVYPNLKQKLSKENNMISIVNNTVVAKTKPIQVALANTQPTAVNSNNAKLSLESRQVVAEKSTVKPVAKSATVTKIATAKKTKPAVKTTKTKWKTYGTKVQVARGTLTTSRGDVVRYKKVYDMVATAYDSSYESCGKHPGDPYYGITASGVRVRPGIIAVDPRMIPLGSRVYVESTDGSKSYGFALAADTGGAIKGGIIDLYFETAREVRNWGRHSVKVYVLE